MKIAIAQIKLIIGDFASNTKNIIENIVREDLFTGLKSAEYLYGDPSRDR